MRASRHAPVARRRSTRWSTVFAVGNAVSLVAAAVGVACGLPWWLAAIAGALLNLSLLACRLLRLTLAETLVLAPALSAAGALMLSPLVRPYVETRPPDLSAAIVVALLAGLGLVTVGARWLLAPPVPDER